MYTVAILKSTGTGEFPTALIYVISEKIRKKRLVAAPSDQAAHG
jgi:Flp pilus assembly CpaF family ATPase